MRKSFVQNIAFLILINLIVKPFWVFGIDRNVQNAVGHEVYGLYQAVFNVTIIFQILLDFGLQSYNSRTVSQSPEAMRGLFPNIVAVKALLALLYIAVTFSFGTIIGYDSKGFLLMCILVALQIALSFVLFFRSNIAAFQRFKTDSVFSVADRIIAIAIMATLLFIPKFAAQFRIEWFALAQATSYLLVGIIGFFFCIKFQKIDWSQIKFKKIRVILKQSLPYALIIFLMSLYTRVDAIMIEKISIDGAIAGKYAAAFRLLDVSNNMTGVLIAGILLPLFGKLIRHRENYQDIVSLSVLLFIPFSLTVAVVVSTWSSDILHLLYKDMTTADGAILMWLIWSFPLFCWNYIFGTLLTANGNVRVLIYVSLFALVLNLGLNFYFIQPEDPQNAVFAARNVFFTQVLVAILNRLFVHKNLDVSFFWKDIFRLLAFAALLLLSAKLINDFLASWTFIPKSFVVVTVAFMLILVLGLLPIGRIKGLIKKLRNSN